MAGFFKKTMGNVVKGKVKSASMAFVTGAVTNSIAKWLGLEDSLVAKVLTVGIPAVMMIVSDDPVVAGKVFDRSEDADKRRGDDSGRRDDGGRRDEESRRKEQEEAEREFFEVFGKKGHAMNKAIAEDTGATEEEVDGIMSAFLPEFERAIADEELEDAGALQRLFGDEIAEIKEKAPRWAKMAGKVVF